MSDRLLPRDAVRDMAPYSPPTSGRTGKLRLDFNENTLGCPPSVAAFLKEKITADRLATYPEYEEARNALAAHFGIEESQFLLTNGTDEAIQILINTYVDPGAEVIILQPSYAMYRFYAELAGARIHEIRYREGNLAFPLSELFDAIGDETRAILISNPNNPTGTATNLDAIEQILERAPAAAILVDEAYFEFYGVTALPLLRRYGNLFVTRTFSKAYGMAGLRLGCLFSDVRNLGFVAKAQSPYSVNVLAALAAGRAVEDEAYIRNYVEEVLAARELLYAGLTRLNVPFFPSQGNFVLAQFGEHAAGTRAALRAAGILVRDRSHEIKGAVRLTVGTREQTKALLSEIERSLRDGTGK
jgi:histidinol-phosphate aminotransferase